MKSLLAGTLVKCPVALESHNDKKHPSKRIDTHQGSNNALDPLEAVHASTSLYHLCHQINRLYIPCLISSYNSL